MTPNRSQRCCRGTALLIVLGTLLLTISAAVIAASAATTRQFRVRLDRDTQICEGLLHATHAPILHWLQEESYDIVLPLGTHDGGVAGVAVLDDEMALDDAIIRVRITAWDECGKVGPGLLRSGSPFRSEVPTTVLRQLDDLGSNGRPPLGLDLFHPEPTDELRIFPTAGGAEDDPAGPLRRTSSSEKETPVLGTIIATHNDGPSRINLNTAPPRVIRQALRLAGRGGIEQIIAARSEGERIRLGALPRDGEPGTRAPELVARSDAWSMRIDLEVNRVRRSWWVVYAQERSRHRTSDRDWRCVQRLAINE